MGDVLLLFPGALGDFLCMLPAVMASSQRHSGARLTIAARPSLLELLPPHIDRLSIDRREVADLFASAPLSPSTRSLFSRFTHIHSWTGHGDPNFAQRLRIASGGAAAIYPFRAMHTHEHATGYYARCLDTRVDDRALLVLRRSIDAVLPRTPIADTLLIHPGSGSPKKNWTGFAALAERWRIHGNVVWLVGPAEQDIERPDAAVYLRDRPLPQIAARLRDASLFVGNDSGISHLAGAVGARGLALFGDTDPVTWRPLGLDVLYTPTTCATCGPPVFCTHRLPVDTVYEVLRALGK